MMYTNSNKEATKSFSFRSKTITKHVEMRNFLRLFLQGAKNRRRYLLKNPGAHFVNQPAPGFFCRAPIWVRHNCTRL